MNCLLCSSFAFVGFNYLKQFKISNEYNINCLFVSYALLNEEGGYEYNEGVKKQLKELLNINKIIDLNENYDFKDKIDFIYINGGRSDNLLYRLLTYNQFNKLKQMIKDGVMLITDSAGTVVCGDYSTHEIIGYPHDYNFTQLFGKDANKGFNFINKTILVHTSIYSVRRQEGQLVRVSNSKKHKLYLKNRKKLNEEEYISLGNDEVIIFKDNNYKKYKFNIKHYPLVKLILTSSEKELKKQEK